MPKMINTTLVAMSVSLLAACGGSGGGSDSGPSTVDSTQEAPAAAPVLETGVFIDSAVEGLRYETASQSGVTNSEGEFQYVAGESVAFSIGDIRMPSFAAAAVVTPLDVFDSEEITTPVANLARLLQTLDADGDASNGIVITEQAHEMGEGISVDFAAEAFDEAVVNLVSNSGGTRTVLIDSESAIEHLQESLGDLAEPVAEGCGEDHPMVGSTASFNTLFHDVAGTIRVVNNCELEITNFTYDGEGPAVAFYGGSNGNYDSEGFALGPAIQGRAYNNETVTIDLSAVGVTLDDFDGISVWCFIFNVNFGDAVF